jgi:tetratricopeptide (TPR) repeat protein
MVRAIIILAAALLAGPVAAQSVDAAGLRALQATAMEAARRGDHAAAAQAWRSILTASETAYGPQHPVIAQVATNLANSLAKARGFVEAEALYRRAISLGGDAASLDRRWLSLAASLEAQGRLADAETVYRQRLDDGLTSPELRTVARSQLAANLLQQGRSDQVEALWRNALVERGAAPDEPPADVETAVIQMRMASALASLGRVGEAEAVLQRAVSALEGWGRDDLDRAAGLMLLAQLKSRRGDPSAAGVLEHAVGLQARLLPADSASLAYGRVRLARSRLSAGDVDGAESLARLALAPLSSRTDLAGPHADALTVLGAALATKGDRGQGGTALAEALALLDARGSRNSAQRAGVAATLARVEAGAGDFASAARRVREATAAIHEPSALSLAGRQTQAERETLRPLHRQQVAILWDYGRTLN